ncbi:MAG: hypothetical protein IJP96_08010 [Synergistaceae bacterium]|nr:hypothetical protein [Synergistaceae bacterium]
MKQNKTKITEYKGTIKNLYDFLKKTTENEIVIRTTRCKGGWHDNEFDANLAGFNICRFINEEMRERGEFSECYRFTRKNRNPR